METLLPRIIEERCPAGTLHAVDWSRVQDASAWSRSIPRFSFRTASMSAPSTFANSIPHKPVDHSYKCNGDVLYVHSRTQSQMFWHRHRTWAFPALISLVLVLLTWPGSLQIHAQPQADSDPHKTFVFNSDPPRQSTNLSDVVQWDNYTLFLNDQRIFLQCVIPY